MAAAANSQPGQNCPEFIVDRDTNAITINFNSKSYMIIDRNNIELHDLNNLLEIMKTVNIVNCSRIFFQNLNQYLFVYPILQCVSNYIQYVTLTETDIMEILNQMPRYNPSVDINASGSNGSYEFKFGQTPGFKIDVRNELNLETLIKLLNFFVLIDQSKHQKIIQNLQAIGVAYFLNSLLNLINTNQIKLIDPKQSAQNTQNAKTQNTKLKYVTVENTEPIVDDSFKYDTIKYSDVEMFISNGLIRKKETLFIVEQQDSLYIVFIIGTKQYFIDIQSIRKEYASKSNIYEPSISENLREILKELKSVYPEYYKLFKLHVENIDSIIYILSNLIKLYFEKSKSASGASTSGSSTSGSSTSGSSTTSASNVNNKKKTEILTNLPLNLVYKFKQIRMYKEMNIFIVYDKEYFTNYDLDGVFFYYTDKEFLIKINLNKNILIFNIFDYILALLNQPHTQVENSPDNVLEKILTSLSKNEDIKKFLKTKSPNSTNNNITKVIAEFIHKNINPIIKLITDYCFQENLFNRSFMTGGYIKTQNRNKKNKKKTKKL